VSTLGRTDECFLLNRLVLSTICQQALRPRRSGDESDEPAPRAEATELLLELLEQPYAERRALLARDPRFHSAPLAALVIAQARRRPEHAERLACTACLILAEVGEEGRGLRVSAKVTLAEAQRRKLDLEEAEATLLSAQEDLLIADLPWERAELCLGLAQLRWEQSRLEEAFGLAERAARLYSDLGAQREAAAAGLEAARWYLALGETREAALSFAFGLHSAPDGELQLAATRGLVQQLVLLGHVEVALELIQDVQRNGGSFTSAQAAVLQSLEGQVLLRLAEPRKAQRLLEDAFAALLGSELRGDALAAGLALLVAGSPPGKVAAQLVALVPSLWRNELLGVLEEIAKSGRVRAEQAATVQKYLDLPEGPVVIESKDEAL